MGVCRFACVVVLTQKCVEDKSNTHVEREREREKESVSKSE